MLNINCIKSILQISAHMRKPVSKIQNCNPLMLLLHGRTNHVIKILADGVELRSLGSLKEVTNIVEIRSLGSFKEVSMLKKLQSRMKKLDKKLKSMKTWRRVSNVLFVSAFVSVLIFSVVAAAVDAPPVVTALAGHKLSS
uniref:Uncharacterized protein n=1 Tax=Salix viminalis TaxID=40686 RepID=A0A6N2LAH4_SALVM